MTQLATTPLQKAKGTWTSRKETIRHLLADETLSVYTFTAKSGFVAKMTKTDAGPKSYSATISRPNGKPAQWLSQDGRAVQHMEISLPLRQAKAVVQENVHKAENFQEPSS